MLQVTNNEGRQFNIRVVLQGDLYGLNDCLIYEKSKPMVEFYDATYQDTPEFGNRGQFVTRYYFSTLCENPNSGILLDGSAPEWNISADNILEVLGYAKGVIDSKKV